MRQNTSPIRHKDCFRFLDDRCKKAAVANRAAGLTVGESECDNKNMTQINSICVFCGSSGGRSPEFVAAAERLGADMAKAGIRLVYGGGDVGLMGATARAVLAAGGRVTGIIPEFLVRKEVMLEGLDDLHVVPDMHTRKRMMFEAADAFVTLPGGIGTLEEVVEQMTWAQLGQHKKPIVLADIGGFWGPLIEVIDHMNREGFIRPGFEVCYHVAKTAADILPTVLSAAAEAAAVSGDVEGDAETIAKL